MSYFLLAILSALLFGAATPISKTLLKSLGLFQLAGLLYLGAALAVAPQAIKKLRSDRGRRLDGKNLARLSGAVFFGGILGPVLLLLGLRWASASSVSMWLNMEMVATAVLGRLIFKDYLGRYGWLGIAGVVAASILLGTGEKTAGLSAGFLVVAACICWGIDNHLTALIDGITPAQSTFWKGIVAGAVNFLIGISSQPLTASKIGITMALIVGAICYGVSITLYITAAQHLGATRSQTIYASAPFFGVMLSVAFLGERLSAIQLLSVVLLVASIAAIFKDRHGHEHIHLIMEHEHLHEHGDMHHDHLHSSEVGDSAHSHWHDHREAKHSHPHWPDLHHRHEH